MALTTSAPAINPGVTSTIASATNAATSTTNLSKNTLASNFTAFLQLLTTQLKNQNPLEPLDTNQFTQQLVQFAQVEQQLKSNDQLSTLVSLQKTAQSTQALTFVGQTVAVDGSKAPLTNNRAAWNLSVPQDASVTTSIKSATGQTVYSANYAMTAGSQQFIWDGRDAGGVKWPDGYYTITASAKDSKGAAVAVATEVEGPVDSVDLTKEPPLLSIAGQTYTLDKIKRVVRAN
jgi:flagellar basal-body rod modification protein FlgD